MLVLELSIFIFLILFYEDINFNQTKNNIIIKLFNLYIIGY